MIGIYKFTNKITGESYIGQSVDIQKRYNQHRNRYDLCGGKVKPKEDTYFHSMLRHYGFNNFDFEVIEECTKDQLNEREIYYIDYYGTLYPNGYNKTGGGNLPHTVMLSDINDVDKIKEMLLNTTLPNTEIGIIYGVSDQTVSDINSGRIWYEDHITYPIRNGRSDYHKRNRIEKGIVTKCRICGKSIESNHKTCMCSKCFKESMSAHLPSKNCLYDLLLTNSFEKVGKMFGVSSNAVRKWCDKYSIPRNSSYYKTVNAT